MTTKRKRPPYKASPEQLQKYKAARKAIEAEVPDVMKQLRQAYRDNWKEAHENWSRIEAGYQKSLYEKKKLPGETWKEARNRAAREWRATKKNDTAWHAKENERRREYNARCKRARAEAREAAQTQSAQKKAS